jgi:hypothetical protein
MRKLRTKLVAGAAIAGAAVGGAVLANAATTSSTFKVMQGPRGGHSPDGGPGGPPAGGPGGGG